MVPKSMDGKTTGCHLYVASKTNSGTGLFFRCEYVRKWDVGELKQLWGQGLGQFDQVLFHVTNTTFIMKLPPGGATHSMLTNYIFSMWNDFPIAKFADASDKTCDNDKCMRALLSVTNQIKVRFFTDRSLDCEEVLLTSEQLDELRLTFAMWAYMCTHPNASLSFLDTEEEFKNRAMKQAAGKQ